MNYGNNNTALCLNAVPWCCAPVSTDQQLMYCAGKCPLLSHYLQCSRGCDVSLMDATRVQIIYHQLLECSHALSLLTASHSIDRHRMVEPSGFDS